MLKDYRTDKIHNVLLAGHGQVGKTTLNESLLVAGGALTEAGQVDRGIRTTLIVAVSGMDSSGTLTIDCPTEITVEAVTRPTENLCVVTIRISPTASLHCCDIIVTNSDGRADTCASADICLLTHPSPPGDPGSLREPACPAK